MERCDHSLDYREAIEQYRPINEQEARDKRVMLEFIERCGDHVLTRNCEIAHITSSGFIMNECLDRVLMVHHNIRNAWAWTGGHADGDHDLLSVAIKEAREETGTEHIRPLTESVAVLDILTVTGHIRRNEYVNAHLHLSVAYILVADETDPVRKKPDENSGVQWFSTERFTDAYFDPGDVYLYNKLIRFAKAKKR